MPTHHAISTELDALVDNGELPEEQRTTEARHWRRFLVGLASTLAFLVLIFVVVDTPTRLSTLRTPQQELDTLGAPNKQSGPRYTATQFISFTINTMGGLAEHGECEGRAVDNSGVCYLGNAGNLTEDVMHRLKLVQEVLNVLKNDEFSESPEIDHRDEVLKIFMIPEFFLRGPHGAYSTAELFGDGILLEASDLIREIISDEEFSDYLFVFGTVIAAESPDGPRYPWEHAQSGKEVLYYNFAPVSQGGPHPKHRYLVTKKYISLEDFLNRTELPNPTNDDIRQYTGLDKELRETFEARDDEIIEDNIIHMDGLKIGLEICLDHRRGTLWSNLKEEKNPPELVDVQLVTSAGMAIERGPCPVVPGGVVYLSDGEASSAACLRSDTGEFDPDKVCRAVEIDGLKHLPHGGAGFSEFFTIAACIDMEKNELLNGYYSRFQTQGCANTLKLFGIDVMDEFKYYPPSIEVYPTVDLPRNTYDN